MKCKIIVNGCDDSTELEMELMSGEIVLLKNVAELITKEAEHAHCKPTMTIEEMK